MRPNSTFSGVYGLSAGQIIGSRPSGVGMFDPDAPGPASAAQKRNKAGAAMASLAMNLQFTGRRILLLHVARHVDGPVPAERRFRPGHFHDLGEVVDGRLPQ